MANSQWMHGQNSQPAASFPLAPPAHPAPKRPRLGYEVPGCAPMFSSHEHWDDRNDSNAPYASIHAHRNEGGHDAYAPYDCYRSSGQSSYATTEVGGGGVRRRMVLPPNACSTLFVEGLPAECSRREVSHIFRPFIGYKELRLVKREPKHPRSEPVTLCFAEFRTPEYAAIALEALQGYKFDVYDSNSAHLRLQFSRSPTRSGAGHRGNH